MVAFCFQKSLWIQDGYRPVTVELRAFIFCSSVKYYGFLYGLSFTPDCTLSILPCIIRLLLSQYPAVLLRHASCSIPIQEVAGNQVCH